MKRKNTALIFVYLILIATIALGAQNQTESVRVYVFTATDPGGFVDADAKQRSDSVEDLKRDLSKDSAIQIISDQATADVTLEVLGRGHEETGSTTSTQDYYGQWHTYPDTVRVVRVGLKAGAYTTLFEGTSSFAQRGLVGVSQGLWRVAASGAAKGIENWIRANHNTLLSKRSGVQSATIASREACIPDKQTPSCRTANAKAVEARLQQKSPDVRVSVEGPNSDTLVEASGQLFDDPVIRDPTKRKELEKALCVYAYKQVVIVNPSNLARYEFEVNCSTNPPASNSDATMMPGPEPVPIPQKESGTGWIGITTTDDSVKGVVITRVLAGSPAEKARLQVGDAIQQMDGVVVKSGMSFDVAIAHSKPGSQIRLSYVRGAWASDVTVTVGKIGYENLP